MDSVKMCEKKVKEVESGERSDLGLRELRRFRKLSCLFV